MSDTVVATRAPKIRLVMCDESVVHEEYCYVCGDGGELLDCSGCAAAYCYSIMLDNHRLPEDQQVCIGLPHGTNIARFVFKCPKCCSTSRVSSVPPYAIIRTGRSLRRVTRGKGQAALALVIFHLPSNAHSSEALSERVAAHIRPLDIEVVVIMQPIQQIDPNHIDNVMSAVPTGYHLWCMLYTESDPRGGWWNDSDDEGGKAPANEILDYVFNYALHGWAERSSAAYLVVISCGVNLLLPSERKTVLQALSATKWDGIIAPASPALYAPDFTAFLPDLIAQTQFIQFDMEEALLRCWLKFPRTRDHTDLYVFDRKRREDMPQCRLWIHAPERRRPWGVELPALRCICSCMSSFGKSSVWINKHHRRSAALGEAYYFFVTSCCRYELHLAVFMGSLRLLDRHGTQVIIAPIDADGEREFDYAKMCTFKQNPETLPKDRPQHTSPWTVAGLDRQRMKEENTAIH